MRSNLPVTQIEYPFPAGRALVSTTDLQGRILYCNPAFIDVSGFDRDELLGQPHNLIRHPDMPQEAFRDMWATISGGQPWSGLVKNRRKNGDHYWVLANVTPLFEGERPAGYMSVRTEASREQIDSAERLYAAMRQDEATGGVRRWVLRDGRVESGAWWARGRRLLAVGTQSRLWLVGLGCGIAGGRRSGWGMSSGAGRATWRRGACSSRWRPWRPGASA